MLLPSTAARRLLPYAVTAGLIATLTGCAGDVEVDAPELSGTEAEACAGLLDALPDELIGEPARDVDAGGGDAAAWGDAPKVLRWRDHPIVLTCGVGVPDDYEPEDVDKDTYCETVSDVDWFVREEGFADLAKDLELFTIGFEPGLELVIPSEYRENPANVADTLATLADPVKEHLERTGRCTD